MKENILICLAAKKSKVLDICICDVIGCNGIDLIVSAKYAKITFELYVIETLNIDY